MSTAHTGWAVAGGLLAVGIAAATAFSAEVHPAAPVAVAASPSTAAAAPTTGAPSPAAATQAATAQESAANARLQALAAQADAELAALAGRLPAGVRLTAPAAWASWTGAHPRYAADVDGCPALAGRLTAATGTPWSYTGGTLPSGPDGCSWATPPAAGGALVDVGYLHGTLPAAPAGTGACADGTAATRLPVPAVRPGAELLACAAATGTAYELAVPDTRGAGVFFLHGGAPTSAQAAAALVAVVTAARHAYA